MTAVAAGLTNVAYGLYRSLVGGPQLVQFLDKGGNTVVQFDATLQESYGHEAHPTQYPVEDGSIISDHVVRSPFTLDITGLVTDAPISGRDAILREGFTTAVSAMLPSLGVVGIAAAYATWSAHMRSPRRSVAAYGALLNLMYGNPDAKPPRPPEPFSVMTTTGFFESMLMTSLSVPRDPDIGEALVFQAKLVRLQVVASQRVQLDDTDAPGLAAMQEAVGEKQGVDVTDTYTPGRIAGLATVGVTK